MRITEGFAVPLRVRPPYLQAFRKCDKITNVCADIKFTDKDSYVNEERVWKMCRLAMYGERDGRKDLNAVRYFRSDYVGLGLLTNFILVTIGYFICILAFFVYNIDFIIRNFDRINTHQIILGLIVFYIILLGLYSVLVYTVRRLRFSHAQRDVLNYYNRISELCDEYDAEAGEPLDDDYYFDEGDD